MHKALSILAVLLAEVGLVCFFLGVGFLKGSFMTHDIRWAYIGIVLFALGSAAVYLINRPYIQRQKAW